MSLLRRIRERLDVSESGKSARGGGRDAPTRTAAQSTTGTATDVRDTDANAEDDEPAVPLDEIFGMLRNQRRRTVLRILTETEQIRLGDLAERVAASEHDKPRERLTSDERKRVYVGLYQVHLPKLADVDAIIYNKSRGIIEPGPTLNNFIYYLPDDPKTASAETQDRRWRAVIANILN